MRSIIRFLAPLALLLTLLAPAGTAAAAPADSERFVAFVGSLNTCNGENVAAEGTMHIVTKTQKDGTFLYRFNLHAQGVGDQGNEYVINWNRTIRSAKNFESLSDRILVISKGSGPNFAFKFYADTNGNFTFEEDCRGRVEDFHHA